MVFWLNASPLHLTWVHRCTPSHHEAVSRVRRRRSGRYSDSWLVKRSTYLVEGGVRIVRWHMDPLVGADGVVSGSRRTATRPVSAESTERRSGAHSETASHQNTETFLILRHWPDYACDVTWLVTGCNWPARFTDGENSINYFLIAWFQMSDKEWFTIKPTIPQNC